DAFAPIRRLWCSQRLPGRFEARQFGFQFGGEGCCLTRFGQFGFGAHDAGVEIGDEFGGGVGHRWSSKERRWPWMAGLTLLLMAATASGSSPSDRCSSNARALASNSE